MSFEIKIGYDEGNAVTGPARVAEALGKAEDGADRARNAMGQFAKTGGEAGETVARGMGQAATAAGTTAGSFEELKAIAAQLSSETVSVSKAAVEAAEAIEAGATASNRQLEVLERILGPAREYNADVNALNALMAQGKVNAAQYDTELERLNTQFGTMHGPISQIAEREAAAVERIRGPMQRYEQEIATLGRVLDQGRITAAEYEAEVDRLNARMGIHQLQGPVSQFADREAAALARIRGPMQQYEQEVDTLRRLVDQGRISNAEYLAELQKQGSRVGITYGAPAAPTGLQGTKAGEAIQAASSHLGAPGQILGKLATDGTVGAAAAITAFVALTAEVTHLRDEYVELSNAAQKLTAAGADVNTTLARQYDLSLQLHAGVKETMSLYDAVRDGTDELNLSQAQQLQLTKEIGDAVIASGGSMGAAEGLMKRLTFAFASGSIGGRDLKSIMKDFPDIGAAFVETMGHSRKELIAMANQGQISSEMLIEAFNKMGPEMEEKVGRRAETTGQMWQHLKDQITLSLGKFAEETGLFDALSDSLKALGEVISGLGEIASISSGGLRLLSTSIESTIEMYKLLGRGLGEVGGAVAGWVASGFSDPEKTEEDAHAQGDLARAYLARMEALKLLGKEEEKNARTASYAAPAANLGIDFGGFDEAAANKWAAMQIEYRQRGIEIGNAYATAHAKATLFGSKLGEISEKRDADKITEDVKRIDLAMNGVNESMDAYHKKWTDLGDQIRLTQGIVERFKSITPAGVPKSQGQIDAENQLALLKIQEKDGGYGDAIVALNQGKAKAAAELEAFQRAAKAGAASTQALRNEYDKAMTAMNDGRLPEAIKFWESLHDPLAQTHRDISALTSLFVSHRIAAAAFEAELSKVTAAHIAFLEATNPSLTRRGPDLGVDIANYDKESNLLGDNRAKADPLGDALEKHARQLQVEREELGKIRGPAEQYRTAIAGLGDLLEKGKISSERYAESVDAARVAFLAAESGVRTLGERIEMAWIKAKQAAHEAGVAVQDYGRIAEETKVAQIQARPGTKSTDDLVAIALLKDKQDAEAAGVAASSYAQVVDRVRAAQLAAGQEGKTFAGGMEAAWIKMRQEADNLGATIANQLVGDLDKLGQALVTVANDGEVSFSAMVDSMIQDLERLLIKQLEIQAVTGLMNLISPGAGDAAASSGLTGSLVDMFPHGGDSGPVTSPSQVSAAPPAYAYPTTSSASQSISSAPSAAPTIVLNNHNYLSDSVVAHALTSRAGERAVTNILRRRGGK